MLSVGKGKDGSTVTFMVFTADYWDCVKHLSLQEDTKGSDKNAMRPGTAQFYYIGGLGLDGCPHYRQEC